MKKRVWKVVSLVLVAAALLTNIVYAAENKASEYISNYFGETLTNSSGMVEVSFNITATGTMPTVGVTKIDIYSMAEGKVATFKYTDEGYEYLMGSNSFCHFDAVYYQGTPGVKHFAIIKFYVADANGSDTATYTTAAA